MERAKHSCVMFCVAALAVVAALSFGSPARAQALLDEVRLGVMAHSIEPSHSEGGADVNVELLFRRPPISSGNAFADSFLRLRLHVGASLNIIGDTSQVYAGLTWDLKLTDRLSLEASFGGSWHDGPLNGSAEDLYGCRVNFRESLSLGYALDDAWTVYATVAHMSNANLCSNNSGITSAGVRIGYKLK